MADNSRKQLIMIDIDGIHPDVLYGFLDDKTTNTSRIAGTGLRAETASAVFPAVTLSCQPSMFTGVFPGRHGIIGNSWFDRHCDPPMYRRYTTAATAAGVYGFGLVGWPTIILPQRPQLQYANNDMAADVKTVYQFAAAAGLDSWQVFNQISRGVGKWIKPTRPEMILFALCHEELVHNKHWDKATFKHLFRDMRKNPLPDLTVFYISGHDNSSHEHGPDTQNDYYRSIVDPLFGLFIAELEKIRPLEEFHFLLAADHCQAKTVREKTHIVTNEMLAEVMNSVPGGGYALFDKKSVRAADTAVMCTEAFTAQVHLKNRQTGRWADEPDFERDTLPAAAAFEKLKNGQMPFVDIVLVRRGFGADYEVFSGGSLISLENFFSGKESEYPDAVRRLKGVNCSRCGDMMVLLDCRKGYYFGDKPKAGEHGGLHILDSAVPFAVSGPGIPNSTVRDASIVDIVPTIGKIMGFETPGVDGKSLL